MVVFLFLTVKLAGHCRQRVTVGPGVSARSLEGNYVAHLSLLSLTSGLYTIARLNDICFKRYGPRGAVKFQEETTGVAQDRTHLVATPKRRRRGCAILAYWLYMISVVSKSSHCVFGIRLRDMIKSEGVFDKNSR